jgi:acetyl esterase/lipase
MPREDWGSVEVIEVDDSGRYCFLLDGYHHSLAHLVRIDLRSGKRVVVAAPRAADIEEALIEGSDVKSVVEYHPRVRRRIFCRDLRKDYELLSAGTGGVPRVRDRADGDRIWLVESSSDVRPRSYYLYDRTSGRVRPLFDSRPGLARYALENMTPVEIPARDGLKLPCYLTLPSWTPKDRPLGTVLLLHGGPAARDYWGFDPEHQWLANRGYAVLSVNYRGSTGFGKRLRRATPCWIAPEMVEDVLDAALWAIERGIADPKRIGVMGASYGGYLVLESLARAPELFQCGVDLFGVSDWKSCDVSASTKRKLGLGPEATRALLEARSPLYHSDRIRNPLLVAQGTSDVRVEPDQSSHLVRKLAGEGKSVTYLVYDEEGHGFYREESRLSYYAVVEAFLASHLGGRQESFGADLEDPGLRIPTGASRIPGLGAFWRASGIIESAAKARVDRLDLSRLALRELPPAIRKLEWLEKLDLSGNRLTHLPPEIGLLTRLETLDLSTNQLLALPEEVGSLRRLRALDVSVNQLSALPPSLRTIETLRRIRIEGNPLTEDSLWGFDRRTWRFSSVTARGHRVLLGETRKSHA